MWMVSLFAPAVTASPLHCQLHISNNGYKFTWVGEFGVCVSILSTALAFCAPPLQTRCGLSWKSPLRDLMTFKLSYHRRYPW